MKKPDPGFNQAMEKLDSSSLEERVKGRIDRMDRNMRGNASHKNTRKNRAEAPEQVDAVAAERLDRFVCAALSTLQDQNYLTFKGMAEKAVLIAKAAIKEIDNV
jgi:hypothetical protein